MPDHTTDHVRIIAEAMGCETEQIVTFSGNEAVAVVRPGAGILESYRPDDLLIFAAHAVAWAERGGYRVRLNEQAEYYPSVVVEHEYHIVLRRDCDPEDPYDTARATLAAVAEVVGMLSEGDDHE